MTKLSVIVPVGDRTDPTRAVHAAYKAALGNSGHAHEFVYVLDGPNPLVEEQLRELQAAGEPIRILKLARRFGESTALCAGFENSDGDVIVTLPAYLQIDPRELPRLVEALGDGDMVIARRNPRRDSFNRLQSRLFHGLLRSLAGTRFHDLGCSVRVLRRRVIDDIRLYGDQHRFLPVLATRQGYRVVEVDAPQAAEDARHRLHGPGTYGSRLLDVLSIFFLVRFTKRPLRFFGGIGLAVFLVGGALLAWLAFQKLVLGEALSDRPLLLLGSLLVVLGVQLFALGLVGEIIIFTHARDIKDYAVEEIVN
jgi:glycosyltransferase involved in cell wall biosynthesis